MVDLSKGAEEEKKGRREENADWLAAERRGIVHELSPNLCCYVIFDERGEREELSRAAGAPQCHRVAVKPAAQLSAQNFTKSTMPQYNFFFPLVQQ